MAWSPAPPVFADPKTDFVFKRIFGQEAHKHLLIELLNALLELDVSHRIVDITYLTPEQRVPVEELKLSILDVKCTDASGVQYVVEMQVLNVEGFEKRVVYNVSKAYVMQLRRGNDYPTLRHVVGVTICDFELWPNDNEGPSVPLLSRWHMREQHTNVEGLPQVQYVFLELPKYAAGEHPQSLLEKWAYFFREADNLDVIPPELAEAPFTEAMEIARVSRFSAGEWEAYDRELMAEQDARGALTLARRVGREEGKKDGLERGRKDGLQQGREQGRAEGRAEGIREAVRMLCEIVGTPLTDAQQHELSTLDEPTLRRRLNRLQATKQWDEGHDP